MCCDFLYAVPIESHRDAEGSPRIQKQNKIIGTEVIPTDPQ